ncbi:hypothetical protein TSUD_123230 [Trifolium subterraneum]|uniref:Uncharacterized protein n=1 Tax=Trifolium subterraneum TaxID=3900 RepID=A0A2Z6LUD1_TRISU|nr:hypothetical protein TSUD_123230 [Trifolium subterraneum]
MKSIKISKPSNEDDENLNAIEESSTLKTMISPKKRRRWKREKEEQVATNGL